MNNKLNLPCFYIGQKVICIKGSPSHGLIEGDQYVLTDVKTCSCSRTIVSWGFIMDADYLFCTTCAHSHTNYLKQAYGNSTRFAPIEEAKPPLLTFSKIKEVEKEEILILN